MKKNSFLTNIRNKRVIRKINLYFFDFTKNGHIFPSKVCHLQYEHGSLFSREIGNHLGRAFPLHFWLNFFIETLPVLNVIKFEDSKHIKRYAFQDFL